MNYVDRFRANLADGTFDPKNATPQDIKTAQLLVGTTPDGIWGNKSAAALDTFKSNYNGPMKFRWQGMTGNEAAQAYSAYDTKQIDVEYRQEELMAKFKENEDKIAQLKQEYAQLQQEESNASESLERDIAANRAGIGDSSQYNVWRSRVESRQAQDKARQADNESSVRTAKSKLNNALRDLSYARGDKETAVAKQMYEDALAEYNEKARKAGMPEEKPSKVAQQDTVTMFDTKDFIRQHRDSNGHWDSEENQKKAYEMAKALGDEGVPLLDEIYRQTTKEKAINDATKQWNAIVAAAKAKASSPEGLDKGSITLEVNNKSIPATVENDGDYKKIVVNGKVAYRWRIK